MRVVLSVMMMMASVIGLAQPLDSLVEERKAFVPTDAMMARASELVQGPLGYQPVDMAQYKNDELLLPTVQQAFRNAWNLPRTSGGLARRAATSTGLGSLVRLGGGMIDVSAGRYLPMPTDTSAAMDTLWHSSLSGPTLQRQRDAFSRLPEETQVLVARIVRAALDADRFIHHAFRRPEYDDLFARLQDRAPEARASEMYRAALSPWIEDRDGQYASTDPFGIDGLHAIDLEALTFSGVILTTHLDSALSEWSNADLSATPREPVLLHTRRGWIVCTGPGTDTIVPEVRPLLAVIDAGGDDVYLGRTASTMLPGQYVSMVIDRSGNDLYDARGDTAAVCAGVLGLAVLVDLEGNDTYRAGTVSIAAAVHGMAVLSDRSGNDSYELEQQYGQAAATAGIAILEDRSGNDTYICAAEGQAYAQTLGAALLVDHAGNDTYLARLDGAPSELYLGQTVSRAQGASFGRRADLGDGHSLAGGVALLLDVRGDDRYTAGAWSQGCGYWWALGMLEDWSGNDTYLNGKYSLGAGAHYAIGVQVDLSGNDAYNVDNSDVVNQYQGHARDASIGVSWDGSGNDAYLFRSHCGGSADLCSIGLFWDRSGDDVYTCEYVLLGAATGWADTPPCGTTTRNASFGTFRDDLPSVGVFQDGVGQDLFEWTGEPTDQKQAVVKGSSYVREP